jgi:mRNA interferase HigB
VRIISRQAIIEFAERHPDALVPLMNWYRIAKAANWHSIVDTRRDFSHADSVGRRTVFNVHGNHYRLIARVNYVSKRIFILRILTHAEYSKGGWKQ